MMVQLRNVTVLPTIPWEDKPQGGREDVLWRYTAHPVIPRNLTTYANSMFNSYKCVGDVPSGTFPCACLVDGDTGRLDLYYGCADTVTGFAFGCTNTSLCKRYEE